MSALGTQLRKLARALRRRTFVLHPRPLRDATQAADGRWHTGGDAAFELVADRFPGGWVDVDLECDAHGEEGVPSRLVFESGGKPGEIARLPRPAAGRIRGLVRLPQHVTALRFEPVSPAGTFRLGAVRMTEIGANEASARLSVPIAAGLLTDPRRLSRAARKVWTTYRRGGVVALRHALIDKAQASAGERYTEWQHHYGALSAEDVRRITAKSAALATRPRFSIVVRGGPPAEALLASLRAQLYPEWELGRSAGDFVCLVEPDDELAPEALYLLAAEIALHPDCDVVYTDEDRIDARGALHSPFFKPEWNPEMLASWNYIGGLAAVRATLAGEPGTPHAFLLEATSRARTVRHVPRVGVHRRKDALTADRAAVERAYPGAVVEAGLVPGTLRVRHPMPDPAPLVSIVIPTRNGFELVEQCLRSIRERTDYPSYEIVLVDNQSSERRAVKLFERLQSEGEARVLRYDAPFNYSAINNLAVREARGELVVLLNNDIEVVSPGWLTELVSHAVRPGVGAVGAKLLYPDGSVQHAGVLLGLGGVAGHIFRRIQRAEVASFGRPQIAQAIGAVTAACLAVRKATYLEVGGLNERDLAVAFNDVDFCLRLLAAGYRNVYTPFAELVHHESLSRGADDTPDKKRRFQAEYDYILKTWGSRLAADPAHNPNLSLDTFDVTLAFPPRADPPWRRP